MFYAINLHAIGMKDRKIKYFIITAVVQIHLLIYIIAIRDIWKNKGNTIGLNSSKLKQKSCLSI